MVVSIHNIRLINITSANFNKPAMTAYFKLYMLILHNYVCK